ncbi:hypothetical protein ACFQ4M_03585 [Thauera mechernichensis]|uniref:Polysaccharide biosynthesis protein n=1 Tax=Thauera mechernichensis TaxID=82788 RepID=A0ABW3W9Y4_9RHOO|nr:hypothetical protein [Thauera mechernichensis]MDG3063492.1 hypothetical protein [Thauera mechernichensis]
MLKIVLSELFSRGLLWLRVILIGVFLSADSYGYLLLLISAEAIFGTLISYPQVKEILVRQRIDCRHFVGTAYFYILCFPFIAIAAYAYFNNYVSVLVVVLSVLFFSGAQTALYLLRVASADFYNKAKVVAAVLSTAVFMGVLPFDPNLLPLSSAIYCLVLVLAVRKLPGDVNIFSPFLIRDQFRGWLIFGSKSLLTQLSLQGNRFVVGAALAVSDVGVFVKSYMLASGVSFVYAAIMIKYEKGLARELGAEKISERLRRALFVLAIMAVTLLVYLAILFGFWRSGLEVVALIFKDADQTLVLIFAVFYLLQAFVLALTPVLIAAGGRFMSLVATMISLVVQALLIAYMWSSLDLKVFAATMVAGHLALVIALTSGFFVAARRV